MNVLTKAIVRTKPTVGAYFAGAQTGRLVDDFWSQLLSIDYAIRSDLRLLRDRGRQLAADTPHVAGFLGGLAANVIGWEPIGILMQAQTLTGSGTRDRASDRLIERGFSAWGENPEACTADGRLTLGDVERMALRLLFTDGEFLARKLDGFPDSPDGFAVQLLDPDLLDETLNVAPGNGRAEIRMGVEVNAFARPVAYHLLTRHPNDLNRTGAKREHVRVPAREIIHRFVPFRPGQTRGVPLLTPVLITQKMLDGYMEAHLVQARAAAAQGGGFFERTGEDAAGYTQLLPSPVAVTGDTQRPALTMPLQPGVYRELPVGLTFKGVDPKAPNSTAPDFQSMMLRTIAVGVGSAYTTYSGDGREMNYGTLRGMTIQERDGFRVLQRFIGVGIASPLYRAWHRSAQLHGMIPLGASDAHRWQYRGWKWIDPANDMVATEGEVALGIGTRTAACGDKGLNFEDVVDQLAEEQAYAESKGVPILGLKTQPIVRPEETDTVDEGTDEERLRSQIETYGIAVRAGSITPQTDDEDHFRALLALPAASPAARAAWAKDKGTRRPITITPPEGQAPKGGQVLPNGDEDGAEAGHRPLKLEAMR